MRRLFRVQLQKNIRRSSGALSRHLFLLHTAEVKRWGASADAFPFFIAPYLHLENICFASGPCTTERDHMCA